MIFPDVRISSLQRDVELKRAAFLSSQERLFDNAHKRLTPATLFKGGAIGSLMGLAGLFFAGKFIMKGGIFAKVMKAGLLMGVKSVMPVIKPLFSSLLKTVAKKF
jgi:hypothetical protein